MPSTPSVPTLTSQRELARSEQVMTVSLPDTLSLKVQEARPPV